MSKLYKFFIVVFTALVLSGCNTYLNETYQEPQQTEPKAKITFAQSTNLLSGYPRTFLIRKSEGIFMNETRTTIKFDDETKNRDFGIPVPKDSKIQYNVYVPADKKLDFNVNVSKYWFTDTNLTRPNRVSYCRYANTEFTPENNGEYLVLIDNIRKDTKEAPRCSLVIKQLIKGKSSNQWVDIEYKFNNNDYPVMNTQELK
ncbi:hypothetical protein RHO14_03285 [Orbus wheelerorum]|uniref:hypothetical protein n=1 Tax=Orbus wheelerorum TaxID=3074111 RepID=UPI00370D5DCF